MAIIRIISVTTGDEAGFYTEKDIQIINSSIEAAENQLSQAGYKYKTGRWILEEKIPVRNKYSHDGDIFVTKSVLIIDAEEAGLNSLTSFEGEGNLTTFDEDDYYEDDDYYDEE